ncbi:MULTISPECIES: TetR/AcrR family transcriptional regulator [Burkholderia]|uniref:TetR/AcrR family transcriptional regulator n=3 Tax=Burkholderiaceae TaxID=119060 RepID=A0A1R1W3J5_9BURK|nr:MULTISPECIES: TetR/AcrR family transcriptional regulator [Burkholderia]KKL29562.1 TetR family transcriptional regulator [Burkholderia contaminans LMG 23361]MBA9835117.1 TetR/AcrR family transcriptional regulator [Burkholderia contaminans]MBA9843063.1 TetR/AcrR family transcriptional regulator [Burkholderia contaminans]MBA9867668.1 TetR/AcrR family transcriptional regulator [Burkholderia contaminans]MBA9910355.1 TetR/AcrR family transcriptional regulator [Burkholderia contaminans]
MPRSSPPPAMDSSSKPQLTPDDWIRAAADVLVDKSVDAVRVEVLSKNLGVTRGSFYWHFKDRDDLLSHLLTWWRDTATEQIIDRFEKRNVKARQLLRDLLALPFHGEAAQAAAATELAIRGWARRDEMARQFVDEVDGKRLSYIAQCFSALGFDIAESRKRAFALYSYELAESLLSNQGTGKQKDERRLFMEQMLLSDANED